MNLNLTDRKLFKIISCKIVPIGCFCYVAYDEYESQSLFTSLFYVVVGKWGWGGDPQFSQRFLRNISSWELIVHIRYCFCKIFLRLRPLNLKSCMHIHKRWFIATLQVKNEKQIILRLKACLECRSQQTIFQRKWFEH